jgi:hypothetical protein
MVADNLLQCSGCGGSVAVTIATPEGQQYGPYPLDAVRQYVSEGRIAPDALASFAGQAWAPVSQVLASVGGAPPGGPAGGAPMTLGGAPVPPPGTVRMTRAQVEEAMRSQLRTIGTWSIIWGVLALGGGALTLKDGPLGGAAILLGLFLLGTGAWVLAAPSPLGFIGNGIGLILVGLANIAYSLLRMRAGHPGESVWIILGGLQLWWGVGAFQRYAIFSKALGPRP